MGEEYWASLQWWRHHIYQWRRSFVLRNLQRYSKRLTLVNATHDLAAGSSIIVLGDKKNDHGHYSVVLDDRPAEVYDGVSGCGGAFGMTCEQQVPTIKYLASNLNGSDHKLTLINQAGSQKSFFGTSPCPFFYSEKSKYLNRVRFG
jgi:hypothetical protein